MSKDIRLAVRNIREATGDQDNEEVARAINAARRRLGMSQEGFAEATGFSRSTIYRWERKGNIGFNAECRLREYADRLEEKAGLDEHPNAD